MESFSAVGQVTSVCNKIGVMGCIWDEIGPMPSFQQFQISENWWRNCDLGKLEFMILMPIRFMAGSGCYDFKETCGALSANKIWGIINSKYFKTRN